MSDSLAQSTASTHSTTAPLLPQGTESQIVTIDAAEWKMEHTDPAWIAALEAGKVLYFPNLAFKLKEEEFRFLKPEMNAEGSRSITLEGSGRFKGSTGDEATQAEVAAMVGRFRNQAQQLVESLLPHYKKSLRMATTSYRPKQVETRAQTWRADDKRLHVDAFAGRPNHGERILRVFANVNQNGVPRVWRVGEPFEEMANKFLPRLEKYRPLHARMQWLLRKTKKLRTEYDHLMLQLHDNMKLDEDYQKNAPQLTMPFPAGSVWVCFSDHTLHAAMAGQYMMEQTLHLQPDSQYDPSQSPLAVLQRLTGRKLV
jgi:hypothetical protein